MTRTDSDRVNDHFTASSSDLTPESVCHAVRVLYAPVSDKPEVTKVCESALSAAELERADRFVKQGDRVLFKQRRAFRRYCGALALGKSLPLSQIDFNETENGRPFLDDLPDYWFSFSSCRFGFIGAWSSTHGIGVDFEDQDRDLETTHLARQFFLPAEARAVEALGGFASQRVFYQFWSLKEAALKSIGEGLPFGIDAFEFVLDPILRVVHAPVDRGGAEQFNACLIEGTASCAALVTRNLA